VEGPSWFEGARSVEPPLEASVVTLGTFDGVHVGHQALVRRTVELARARRILPVAYTFAPHPAKVLAPRFAPRTLMALDRRVARLHHYGIERVVVEPFDAAFASVEADDWVRQWLVDRLRPQAVVVGYNFTFGRERKGNPERLRELGQELGFEVVEIEPVRIGGLTVSSTKVREFLQNGNVAGATELLGRPFALTGSVIRGDGRGHGLGFPTANLLPDAEILPAHGVYASTLAILGERGAEHPAVTNVGLRPTFDGSRVTVETHVIDAPPDFDLYEQRVEVKMVQRIRGEERFDGVPALVAQVQRDIESARRLFAP
jgi:riboflavin kinase/FMN adenylyltransferase